MKAIFRILGTAAAVAATGAAIVIMDKLLNEKAAPIIESIEFPEEAEKDDAEAAKTAEAYAEGEAKAEAEAAAPAEETAPAEEPAAPETEASEIDAVSALTSNCLRSASTLTCPFMLFKFRTFFWYSVSGAFCSSFNLESSSSENWS